jgi:PEP-CTERM motif
MRMVKSAVAVVAAIGLSLTLAQAGPITVNWAASTAGFVDGGGTPLAIGDLVQIGIMSGGTSISNFTPWASGAIGDSFGLPGVFSISTDGDDTAPVNAGGKQIYMVAFNSVGPSANYAIITGTFAVNQWRFPLASDVPNDTTIDAGDNGVAIVAGTQGPAYDVFGDGSYVIPTVAVIPEPSTWTLVGAGLLGLVGLARRRRS